jgi:hypothetical protein
VQAWAADDSPEVVRAREAFVEGTALARATRWGDALQKFETSSQLHAHAGTTFNIGVCQRALGQYTRARKSLHLALKQHEDVGGQVLADSLVNDIKTFLSEIEQAVATLDLTLEPASASILIDGRPLEPSGTQDSLPRMIAGTLAAGAARTPPSSRFLIVLDPGTHVLVLSRKGFSDIVHRETVQSGVRSALTLSLERLPATLMIESTEARAAISVDGIDVGIAPITLSRPPGSYHVVARKKEFLAYETDAELQPGEKVTLRAVMRREQVSLTSRWWFWTGIGVAVVGTAVGTWYATRPEPDKPALNGGGLGWTVRVP